MESLPMLSPAVPTSMLLTWDIESDADLRRIREDIRRFFAERTPGPAGDKTEQHMGLVATELAGNALRHGRPPAVARLLSSDGHYILDVSDGAVGELPRPDPAPQNIHAGGRGLPICLAVAEQVGWYTTGTAKHVWASFPRPR
jgi:serine/threonine-protein kinase RsbW